MALEQPKKPVGGAFGRFTAEKRADFQKQCAGQPVTAVTKLAAETWGKLSDKEKAPYQKVFEAAQAKYTKDFAAFIEAGGVKTKGVAALRADKKKAKEGRKGRAAKDPNRPKKPAGGAYGCFLDKNRQQFAKECQGQSVTAVTKLASARWKLLPEKERAVFEKAYGEKKATYLKAMESYVPPAGAAEEKGEAEESGEEDEDDEEEEEAAPSPPAKKARTTQKTTPSPQAKKAETKKADTKKAETTQKMPADVMAEAKKEKLHVKLTAGKVPAAKRALLGA